MGNEIYVSAIEGFGGEHRLQKENNRVDSKKTKTKKNVLGREHKVIGGEGGNMIDIDGSVREIEERRLMLVLGKEKREI